LAATHPNGEENMGEELKRKGWRTGQHHISTNLEVLWFTTGICPTISHRLCLSSDPIFALAPRSTRLLALVGEGRRLWESSSFPVVLLFSPLGTSKVILTPALEHVSYNVFGDLVHGRGYVEALCSWKPSRQLVPLCSEIFRSLFLIIMLLGCHSGQICHTHEYKSCSQLQYLRACQISRF
jgi:hypothetical protein